MHGTACVDSTAICKGVEEEACVSLTHIWCSAGVVPFRLCVYLSVSSSAAGP